MKFCGLCDQPIQDGEENTTHDKPSASGAGTAVYRHVALCKRVPTQTAQASPRH
ncbi:hypothetical protein OG762_23610 [Streptomyces sp. NBC_01136]|uniref:hypothetical protein n=1 Tax=Streptomyces sp. NBC_01136 TaxID=2903754 RepID=UPI00387077EC|nr:hypothetical protein OG762_23610 [Streptomyces sp. NBC_01136]